MMCVSIPGCIATATSEGQAGVGMFVWTVLFFVGIGLFIVGRFQE